MSNQPSSLRDRMYVVIFRSDTKAGRAFDLILLWMILFSVIAVMLESIQTYRERFGSVFLSVEWLLTIFFTLEYVARVYCAKDRKGYVLSFFGIVDLLAVMPTYLALSYEGTQALMVIRAIRLMRIFRLLKLTRHVTEAQVLLEALRASRAKITVFLGAVLTLTLIAGSAMYLIEGEEHGFTSIPQSVYWAIVTMTTVGYGDISPKTPLGQFLASLIMIAGYGILAVPTGIVSVELQQATRKRNLDRACVKCGLQGHEATAAYCRNCGSPLPEVAGI